MPDKNLVNQPRSSARASTSEAFRKIERIRYRFSQAKLGMNLTLNLLAFFAEWLNRLEVRQEATEAELGALSAEVALMKDPPLEPDAPAGE